MGNLIEVCNFYIENESIQIYFKYNGEKETESIKTRLIHRKTGLIIYQCFFSFSPNSEITYWIHTSPPDQEICKSSDSISHDLSSILGECILDFSGDIVESHSVDFCGQGRPFMVLDKEVKPHTFDEGFGTFLEVNIYQIYNNGPVSLLPGDVVLDIGANYGFFSLYALNRGAKKIIALEPFSLTYDHLLKNVQEFKQIETLNEAISYKDGIVQFSNSGFSTLNCVLSEGSDTEGSIQVKGTSINSLIERYSLNTIDFLKVDCEGGEMELFESIADENLRKVNRTVIEYHSNYILNLVLNRLESSGFKIYEVRGSSDVGLIYAYR